MKNTSGDLSLVPCFNREAVAEDMKIRSALYLFLLLAGMGKPAYSQSDTLFPLITVEGQLIGMKSGEPVPFAHIVNKNQVWGTVTDSLGHFTMQMSHMDTLAVSAIGYESQQFVLPIYVSVSPFRTRIFLRERSYPIDEVEVFVLGTWEQFQDKVRKLRVPETEEEELKREIRDEAKEVALEAYEIPTGITFSLPSRYDASLKRLREIEAIEARQILIYRKYNREVIARTTGLTGKELDDFIIFCNQRAWFTPETPSYDIIRQIKYWFRQYLMIKHRMN
ncbi:MAG TPA: carboxypeptidase-like regulatory domain-containing protein [Bacteroidetes bacterium]|nr:carboxypeptidase-like regulatory domain-containing protein [Bacteroidota bacterium]